MLSFQIAENFKYHGSNLRQKLSGSKNNYTKNNEVAEKNECKADNFTLT